MKISYQNNNFNALLAIFNSSCDFKVYSKALFSDILCHVEVAHLTFNENQLTGFSMMQVFTESCVRADFHFSLNVNITIASYTNSTSRKTTLHNFLQQWMN